ncbi:MAG: SCO family protein [Phycisphaeraceae bacterium]
MTEDQAEPTPAAGNPDRPLLRLLLFAVLAALIATALAAVVAGAVAGARWMAVYSPTHRDEPLPVLFDDMPAFELTDQHDRTVTPANLEGRIWIASFIFTRCGGICPMITAHKSELQRLLDSEGTSADDVQLVSFSVDPGHDTPAVLREYADRYDADPDRWLFLTGERDVMWRLVGDGFRLMVEEQADESMPIAHSNRFVLVDRAGRIRGYYDALDLDKRTELLADLQWLLAEGE